MSSDRPTIFALSSGRPPAGVAVVRISGPKALESLTHLAGTMPDARVATLASLRDPAGLLLDRALVLAFPAPHSFTGEDVAELHLHGGAAVVAAVLSALDGSALRRPKATQPPPGGLSNHKDRHGTTGQNLPGHTAEHDAAKAAASVRSHGDKTAITRLGGLDDGFGGHGVRHMQGFDGDTEAVSRLLGVGQDSARRLVLAYGVAHSVRRAKSLRIEERKRLRDGDDHDLGGERFGQ